MTCPTCGGLTVILADGHEIPCTACGGIGRLSDTIPAHRRTLTDSSPQAYEAEADSCLFPGTLIRRADG